MLKRKLTSLLLAGMLALSVGAAACSDDDDTDDGTDGTEPAIVDTTAGG